MNGKRQANNQFSLVGKGNHSRQARAPQYCRRDNSTNQNQCGATSDDTRACGGEVHEMWYLFSSCTRGFEFLPMLHFLNRIFADAVPALVGCI